MNWQFIFLASCVSLVSGWPAGNVTDPNVEDIPLSIDKAQDGTEGPTVQFPEKWNDWKTWKAPEKIINFAPYYKSGYDYDGLPIIVLKYGEWNYRELAQLKLDQLRDFWKHYEQFARRAESEAAANDNAGIVFITDWDGFSLESYGSSGSLKLALKVLTGLTRFNNAIRYGFMINTNFGAETFTNMIRPFMGDMLDKFEIYGTRREKWKPALLRKIPASQLPPEYGGYKAWKPAEWNNQ